MDADYGILPPNDIKNVSLSYVLSRKDVTEMSPEEFAQKFCETYKQIITWSNNNNERRNLDIQEAERIKKEESKKHYFKCC